MGDSFQLSSDWWLSPPGIYLCIHMVSPLDLSDVYVCIVDLFLERMVALTIRFVFEQLG